MNKGLLEVDEALERLLAGARPVAEAETVPTLAATGRVLAAAQRSTMNVPPMDNSAMDGYAVRTADVQRPETRLKVAQKIPAGSTGKPLAPGTAARIFTGAPIPPGNGSGSPAAISARAGKCFPREFACVPRTPVLRPPSASPRSPFSALCASACFSRATSW